MFPNTIISLPCETNNTHIIHSCVNIFMQFGLPPEIINTVYIYGPLSQHNSRACRKVDLLFSISHFRNQLVGIRVPRNWICHTAWHMYSAHFLQKLNLQYCNQNGHWAEAKRSFHLRYDNKIVKHRKREMRERMYKQQTLQLSDSSFLFKLLAEKGNFAARCTTHATPAHYFTNIACLKCDISCLDLFFM